MNGYFLIFLGLVGFMLFLLQDRQEVCKREFDRKK